MNEDLAAQFYLHFLQLFINKRKEVTKLLNESIESLSKLEENHSFVVSSQPITLPNLDDIYTNIINSIVNNGYSNINYYLNQCPDISELDRLRIINEIRQTLIILYEKALIACSLLGNYINTIFTNFDKKNNLREQLKSEGISPKRKVSEIRFWQTIENSLAKASIISDKHKVRSLYDISLLKVDDFIKTKIIEKEKLTQLPKDIREKFEVDEFSSIDSSLLERLLQKGTFDDKSILAALGGDQNKNEYIVSETVEYVPSDDSDHLKRKFATIKSQGAHFSNQDNAEPVRFFVAELIKQLKFFSILPNIDCVIRNKNKISIIFPNAMNDIERFSNLTNYLTNKIIENFMAPLFMCSIIEDQGSIAFEIMTLDLVDSERLEQLLDKELPTLQEPPNVRRKLSEKNDDCPFSMSELIANEEDMIIDEEKEFIIEVEEFNPSGTSTIRRFVTPKHYSKTISSFRPQNSPSYNSFEELNANFSKENIENLQNYLNPLEITNIKKEDYSIIITYTNAQMIADEAFCSNLTELLKQCINENNTQNILSYSDDKQIFIIAEDADVIAKFHSLFNESFPNLDNNVHETRIAGLNF